MNIVKIVRPLYDADNNVMTFELYQEFTTIEDFDKIVEEYKNKMGFLNCDFSYLSTHLSCVGEFKSKKTGLTSYQLIYKRQMHEHID